MTDKDLINEIIGDLNWAYMTINDQLKFGLPEEMAIRRRELRVKGVLLTSIRKMKVLENSKALAQYNGADKPGGEEIEEPLPDSQPTS